MNCLEFRRVTLVRELPDRAGWEAHRAVCPACDRYAARQDAFEERLAAALAIEVAPALARRAHAAGSRPRPAWLAPAIAASVALLLAVSGPIGRHYRDDMLQLAIMDKVREQQRLLPPEAGTESVTEARALLNDLGLELRTAGLRIERAWPCVINGNDGVHLVISGARGSVSVIMLPQQPLDGRHEFASQFGEYSGVMLPFSTGTVAIVGRPDEPLTLVEGRVRGALATL